MLHPKALVPRPCTRKVTGRTVVYLNRKPVYLGKGGMTEARKAYSDLLTKLDRQNSFERRPKFGNPLWPIRERTPAAPRR